jgi:hypothetical protein
MQITLWAKMAEEATLAARSGRSTSSSVLRGSHPEPIHGFLDPEWILREGRSGKSLNLHVAHGVGALVIVKLRIHHAQACGHSIQGSSEQDRSFGKIDLDPFDPESLNPSHGSSACFGAHVWNDLD